jgi:DNA adenine methylase
LSAAFFGKARKFILNDLNDPLMRLWGMIIENPEAISSRYRELWLEQEGREREYYDLIRDRFNETQRPEFLLYLLARCVKASIRYNADGEFNQSPDNRRKGAIPETMKWHILRASKLLKGKTTLFSEDYSAVLRRATPDDIIYMDPPYQGVCGQKDPRYLKALPFEAFAETLAELNSRGLSYVVSYDGRTGGKTYGKRLPDHLNCKHIEIVAGRSSQATLLGRSHVTYESLYLSPALIPRIASSSLPALDFSKQLCLFEAPA